MNISMMMLMAEYISPALQKALQIIAPILMILMVLIAIALIIVILSQKGDPSEVTAISGTSSGYAGKNKAEDSATRLKKLTYILGGAMLVVSVLYFVIQLIGRQS